VILSAQRVRSPSGALAINCMHFAQDPAIVVADPIERLQFPGWLTWQYRPLPRPGNRIVSYVDVAAPEDVTVDEVSQAIGELIQLPVLPRIFASATRRVGFSIVVDPRLAEAWRNEVLDLLGTFFQVHP
jgi:hypothetical protein